VSAIHGLVRLDGPVEPRELEAMAAPIRHWGPDGGGVWCEGGAGLGQLVAHRTPEAVHQTGPVAVAGGMAVVAAAARLDNRDELCRELGLGSEAADGAIVGAAYERWELDAARRLLGDWAFAAWHPRERRLVLARDHYGQTALYHHFDGTTLAFASGLKGLFALPHVPRRLNELRVAQHVAAWRTGGAATVWEDLFRLPPAHTLVLEDGRVTTREYWHPRDAPDVRLGSDGAYVERFLELFAAAVRSRVRTTGSVASTLSAGLDSGAVTGLAAREVADLVAYTSAPAHPEVAAATPGILVDEWPDAARVAALYPNVEHVRVTGGEITPLEAIERSHDIHEELEWGVGNLPWILGLLDAARDRGIGTLLTGQVGNGGVSWAGEHGAAFRLLVAGEARAAGRAIVTRAGDAGWPLALRWELAGPLRRRARLEAERWRRSRDDGRVLGPLVAPDLARRLDLAARMRASGYDPLLTRATAEEARLAILLPGVNPVGAIWHEHATAHGLEVLDPTADVRLLEFCLGVPPDQWVRGDRDRWLMRRALEGLVPPDLQWSRRRGQQGADIAHRLRADAEGVEAALRQVEASDVARSYVNAQALRKWWEVAREDPVRLGLEEASQLARGLSIALFVLR
jgi:asparagine synthase (glutamine-hydrolysing)